MHKLFLCWRYLCKRRIAFFGIGAVGLCVGLLIVITSLFGGFIREFGRYQESQYGQVLVRPYPYGLTREGGALSKAAERLESLESVARVRVVAEHGGMLYLGKGDVRGVQLVGIEADKQAEEGQFREGLLLQGESGEEVSFALPEGAGEASRAWLVKKLGREPREVDMPVGAIFGIGLLAKTNELTDKYDRAVLKRRMAELTEPMVIITSKAGDREAGQERAAMLKVRKLCWPVDVIETGVYFTDTHTVYMPLEYVRGLNSLRDEDGVTQYFGGELQITGASGYKVATVVEEVEGAWVSIAREEWGWPEEWINKRYITASADMEEVRWVTREIRRQLAIIQLMVGLVCLVAALLVFVILFMIVMQKRRDIGIVRAVGGTRWGTAVLFLGYGAAIGGAGSLVGLALGVWATRNINFLGAVLTKILGVKIWQSGVYLFSRIPNEVAWESVGWILGVGVLTAMAGAVLPAMRAARLEVVEALRYE